jgi:hypothetical protein
MSGSGKRCGEAFGTPRSTALTIRSSLRVWSSETTAPGATLICWPFGRSKMRSTPVAVDGMSTPASAKMSVTSSAAIVPSGDGARGLGKLGLARPEKASSSDAPSRHDCSTTSRIHYLIGLLRHITLQELVEFAQLGNGDCVIRIVGQPDDRPLNIRLAPRQGQEECFRIRFRRRGMHVDDRLGEHGATGLALHAVAQLHHHGLVPVADRGKPEDPRAQVKAFGRRERLVDRIEVTEKYGCHPPALFRRDPTTAGIDGRSHRAADTKCDDGLGAGRDVGRHHEIT